MIVSGDLWPLWEGRGRGGGHKFMIPKRTIALVEVDNKIALIFSLISCLFVIGVLTCWSVNKRPMKLRIARELNITVFTCYLALWLSLKGNSTLTGIVIFYPVILWVKHLFWRHAFKKHQKEKENKTKTFLYTINLYTYKKKMFIKSLKKTPHPHRK